MSLPRILKDLMIFNDGTSYIGEANAFTQPKLTRKLEEWRGAGMDRPIKIDMGAEPLEAEFTCGGPMKDVLAQYGVTTVDGVMLRFQAFHQNDQTGASDLIEVTMRGRHEEIDMGESKIGEPGEFKVKSALAYYKLDWNGRTVIEIDPMNMVLMVDGVDRLADRRTAFGL